MRQYAATEENRVVPFDLTWREGELRVSRKFRDIGQLPDQRQEIALPLGSKRPEAGWIAVGPAVRVSDRQLGLALAPEAVDGHDAADRPLDRKRSRIFDERSAPRMRWRQSSMSRISSVSKKIRSGSVEKRRWSARMWSRTAVTQPLVGASLRGRLSSRA
jgi:hypothetical protein